MAYYQNNKVVDIFMKQNGLARKNFGPAFRSNALQGFKANATKGITAAIGANYEAAVFRGDIFERVDSTNLNY